MSDVKWIKITTDIFDDEKILHADGRDICQPKRQALKIRKHDSLSPFAPAPGTMPWRKGMSL